ncbi:MAG: sugar ABC transporter permease, partial [Clostridiales bacterium]|nr:sugar ABC transporter permease [Clostridiales bacterium]
AQNFVGLENYINAFKTDEVNRRAILNTIVLTAVCVSINLFIGFLLANFLFRIKGHAAEAGKVILFIPYILSFAAVGVLFSFIFSSTDLGRLNKVLSIFGTEPFPWFGSTYTAMPAIILSHAWKDFGFSLLLYYAGLQTIPASLLEACDMDGATGWQKTWKVKLPCLRPITQTLVVLAVIRYMLTFTMIMFLTPDGGPEKSTEVVASWFYKQSFQFWEFGYGAALAIILALIVMLMTVALRRILKEEEVGL